MSRLRRTGSSPRSRPAPSWSDSSSWTTSAGSPRSSTRTRTCSAATAAPPAPRPPPLCARCETRTRSAWTRTRTAPRRPRVSRCAVLPLACAGADTGSRKQTRNHPHAHDHADPSSLAPTRIVVHLALTAAGRRRRGSCHVPSQASAATARALTPVSRVGWMTGAKVGLWLTGMSWASVPFLAASAYRSGSMPPMPQ